MIDRLGQLIDDLGCGKIIHVADFGAMPNWLVRKSLTLMAQDVIPHFRDAGGKPVWAIEDMRPVSTHTEFGAQRHEPKAVPEARIHGHGVVDVRTAHVAELRDVVRD